MRDTTPLKGNAAIPGEHIPKLLSRREAFSGKLLHLVVDRLRSADGAEATREVVLHPPAVAILPILTDGSILLVKQYRHPTGAFLWEIPAGLIDPGESALVSAKRELQEETGYVALEWEESFSFFTSPGFTDEIITLYQASELSRKSSPDPQEIDACRSFSPSEIIRFIKEGKIEDAKTILAVLARIAMSQLEIT